VTSNQHPWQKTISPHFETADAERIAQPPVTLEGLSREQGDELIRLRMKASEAPAESADALLAGNWLGTVFTTPNGRVGTRQFLQRCKIRWEQLRNAQPLGAALAELYEARRVNLLAEPKRLVCDADMLQWFVKTCAAGLPGVEIDPVASRYFNVAWRLTGRTILFGFEAGSNWRRWDAIAREAQSRREQLPQFKAVYFRGEEQPAIPGPDWFVGPAILEARKQCLHLIVLTRDDFAALYAGYDLYADALGGDIPPFEAPEVLAFLRTQFERWWARLLGPIEGQSTNLPKLEAGKVEAPINEEVRRIVAAEKFLSVDEVIARLGTPCSREEVLLACGYSAEIRVHAHPQMTVLQWQST
jgi:hypothetical protein